MTVITLIDSRELAAHVEGAILDAGQLQVFAQARDLLDTCRRKGAALEEEGRIARAEQAQAGFQQGLRDAAATAAERLLEFERAHAEDLARREAQVVEMVDMVLDRIAPTLAKGELVRALARGALEQSQRARKVLIRVHPSAVAAVEADLDAMRLAYPWIETIEVHGAPECAADDCQLETPNGFVNAGWRTQRAAIGRLLSAAAAP